MPQTTATLPDRIAEWSETDTRLMQKALALAERGVGQVSPGPLVGCVVASASGEVAGEGFYVYENMKHAETYALEQAGDRAKGGTAYVSLEPHAHYGRTPPCTDALINAGISRVVCPIEDPNPKVSGKGFNHLRAAGVEVEIGLLADEARKLNEKYCHFMLTGRPFVHLKLAASLDGKIATRSGESQWITGPDARQRVQELRHEYDAIMVGAGTAVTDDPLLTDRSGLPRAKQLTRVVLDEHLTLPLEGKLVSSARQTPLVVFCGDSAPSNKVASLRELGVEVVSDQSNGRDPFAVLTTLGDRLVQSVLVEGGAGVAGKLLDAGLVNKISFFLAPIVIGGREAPSAIGGNGAERLADALRLADVEVVRRGQDFEITGYPRGRDDN
jgi:diaminohydroxyphosphoribosylaminopyrimidine deaminase/5-amino-6-(5-phosphoribosylamino)uracil reductase